MFKIENEYDSNFDDENVCVIIDGDTLNNEINNLFIATRSEHKDIHNSLQKCIGELYLNGIVKFREGEYYV